MLRPLGCRAPGSSPSTRRARSAVAALVSSALVGLAACSAPDEPPSPGGSPSEGARPPDGETVAGASPSDAPMGRFCRVYVEVADAMTPAALADWADRMLAVGTPAGIGVRQRAGFEVLTTVAAGPNAEPEAPADGSDPLGPQTEQDAALAAFGDYVAATCAQQIDSAQDPGGEGSAG